MSELDIKKAEELEKKYDSSFHTRPLSPLLGKISIVFSIVFAAYHYVTAGIGVPVDYWHMGVHMSGVIFLVFLAYPMFKAKGSADGSSQTLGRFGNVPLLDWLFIVVGIAASLYIGVTWYEIKFELFGIEFFLPEQVIRQGDPAPIDVVFGTLLIVVLLEAVRRSLGIIVPIIILVFTAYAVFGQYIPIQILKAPGHKLVAVHQQHVLPGRRDLRRDAVDRLHRGVSLRVVWCIGAAYGAWPVLC